MAGTFKAALGGFADTLQGDLYKYGVTPTTTGFDEAPVAILKALKRLTWAGQYAMAANMQAFQDFNELLLLGYHEKCHIGVSLAHFLSLQSLISAVSR